MSQQTQTRKEIEAALIAKAQAEPAFRQSLLSNPRAAIERELGFHLPASADLRVVEETPATRYLVLPTDPDGELSDSELESVAGGTGKSASGHGGGGSFGVQKDKMQSANKNSEATRALL